MARIGLLAYAILDGTLIPIDRVADQKPYYSGCEDHHRHGVNVQVIADPAGRLIWASAALPGSSHDLTAARTHGIIDTLTSAKVMTFADKAYQGARGNIRTPFNDAIICDSPINGGSELVEHAIGMLAVLPGAAVLTNGERALMTELLDRIAG